MKIRTQLIISMVIFSLALLIIAASVITTDKRVAQLNAQEELANSIELKANELGYLSNDFLMYQEKQQVDRWNSKYTSINDDLANLTVDTSDQQALVDNIEASQQRLKEVFADIVAHTASASHTEHNTVDLTFIQVSSSRIGVQTQGIVFDASRLSRKITDEEDHLKLVNYLLIIALLGVFGVFLLTIYYLIYRRTLKSIADLQAGTQIIGSGNLDHTIEEKNGDEFGELTGAFNRMTAQLKMVTASKADLEKEITERMRAEDALRASEEKYRSIVDTATEGIWMADPDGRTTFVNKIMAEMIGYSPKEMIGKSAYDFMDEEARAIASHNLKRRRQGFRDSYEQKYIRKDGSILWAIVSATPLRYNDGQIIAIMGMLTDITERKRAEEELRYSANILENLSEAVITTDARLNIRSWNKGAENIYGWKAEDVIGKLSSDILPSRYIGRTRDEVYQKFMEKGSLTTELISRRKDGSEVTLLVTGTLLEDNAGKITGTVNVATDITERKSAEILSIALNNINLAINSSLDFNRIMETATVEATRVIGFSRATVALREGDEWVLKYTFGSPQRPVGYRYSDSEVRPIIQLSSQKKPIILNNLKNDPLANRYEAERYDVKSAILLPLVMNDEVIGLLSFFDSATVHLTGAQVDFVTNLSTSLALAISNAQLYDQVRHELKERAKAEDALRDVGNYLESLINYANAPIIVWDPAFRITRFNHAFEHLTGYSSDEVIGKGLSILFPEVSREESLAKIRLTLCGHWESVEIPILCKDDRIRIALWNSANITGKDGMTIVATIAQGQDITDRKLAEKELLEAKMQAELYLDLMGHDINNMHQIAIGYLELAMEALVLDDSERYLINKPLETMQRSAKLIENVRKLQQVQAGEIKEDVIDLDAALAIAVDEYRVVANAKITFNNGSGPHKVMANALIADVFSNIIGNAIKHANVNGPIVVVSVDKEEGDGKMFYKVSVEDNGPGIPDDLKDKVFNRLQRGTTKARGVGLGLYLVKSLVESYHGQVWVEDRVTGDYTMGSKFVVMLPAIDN